MIKNLISISLCLLFISYSWAQEPKNDKEKAKTDGYEFTDTKIAEIHACKRSEPLRYMLEFFRFGIFRKRNVATR